MVRFRNVFLGTVASVGSVIAYCKYRDGRKKLPDGSHVVIVGAGYGGLTLASKMHGKGGYTLIDAKDSMHHNLAALRAVVEPGFAIKTFLPLAPQYGDHFRQGRVVSIDTETKTVSLAGEEQPIPYTHLVLATGSSGPFPGKCDYTASTPDLLKQYEDFAQTIKKSQKVVVIGGGAVGVEIAAEIAKEYPKKSVTVVHNGETLVTNKLTTDALSRIKDGLSKLNVKVVMGDTVENMGELPLNQLDGGMVVKTSNGLELPADLVIPCIGLRVNSEAYATSIPDKVNSRGQLMVDNYFQVKDLDQVYAIGDCNDFPVMKMALESQLQASHLWGNLVAGAKPKPYKDSFFKMVVPLGREGGVLQVGSKVFGDLAAKAIKSKEVLVPRVWKLVGLPVPEKTTPKDV